MADATRTSLLRKRSSRLAAAQALYAHALKQDRTPPPKLIKQVVQSWADSKTFQAADLPYDVQPEQALLSRIVLSAVEHSAPIETAIESTILPHWKKSRMSLPLLSTLRAAAGEHLAFPQKKRGMLIEEYTEIAAQLVADEEVPYAHKALNLLLDALAVPPAASAEAHG